MAAECCSDYVASWPTAKENIKKHQDGIVVFYKRRNWSSLVGINEKKSLMNTFRSFILPCGRRETNDVESNPHTPILLNLLSF